MAASSLFALIDDIATLLDDISTVSVKAASKSAGVVGDDIALTAGQFDDIRPARELPIIWAITKGSLRNKLILVPFALLLSAFMPMVITPLLMLGGAYLAYEGIEKIREGFGHENKVRHSVEEISNLLDLETKRIKSAITTDFILSAEIIIIALESMHDQPMKQQIISLSLVALGITLGVYGLVALIIKIDDFGFYLEKSKKNTLARLGKLVAASAPKLLSAISVIGTWAMLLVGGGIYIHAIADFMGMPGFLTDFGFPVNSFVAIIVGALVGFAVCAIEPLFRKDLYRKALNLGIMAFFAPIVYTSYMQMISFT